MAGGGPFIGSCGERSEIPSNSMDFHCCSISNSSHMARLWYPMLMIDVFAFYDELLMNMLISTTFSVFNNKACIVSSMVYCYSSTTFCYLKSSCFLKENNVIALLFSLS